MLTAAGRAAVPALVDDGLLTDEPADAGRPRRVVLTLRGRLLTDTVVRALLR
ncbi:hypothetical protein BN11_3960004 [Nostocoides australiense Ben110]|uniref:HemN C-terminal domain-containing protein n=1 Tax=Nostocoides australiense Ben110 TaxID=1193182 RepID=W6JX49_9MICO|nr:hypothetical protein BN11_3960004 [Tetrasphaera australiensis Ben110]